MIEINGIDEYLNKLQKFNEDFEGEFENEAAALAYKFLEKVVQRIPAGNYDKNTESIKESFVIGPLVEDEEGLHIQIYNANENAKKAEYGYMTIDTTTGNLIFKPGTHFMKISLQEFKEELDLEIKQWLNNFWEGEFRW